jgi:hypothetical protein
MPNGGGFNASHNWNAKLSASYVTGSHAAKFGINFACDLTARPKRPATDHLFVVERPPRSVTVNAAHMRDDVGKANIALFGQDQWTVNRVTINACADYCNAHAPAQHLGPGRRC